MQKTIMRKFTDQKFTLGSAAWLTWLLIAIVLFAATPSPAYAQDGPPAEEPTAQLFEQISAPIPPFIPGTVLVGLRGDIAASSINVPTWGDIEVLAAEPLDLRTGEVGAASRDGLGTDQSTEPLVGYKLTVPVGTEWGAIEVLVTRGDVAFAEPDWLAQIAQGEAEKAITEIPYAVSDTLYREQWYTQRIGMSRAWSLAQSESEGNLRTIEVVVIDTGADFAHPDLSSVLGSGHNYLDSSKPPQDDNGHGTHISGLIAAAMNGVGIVGTGLHVEIVPFKALNQNGLGGVSAIGQAIRDAADQDVDIINMSLELSVDTFVLRSAVQYAVEQGVLVIAASGNQGKSTVSYPAAYPSVMAVGSSTYFDARAYYSNKGADLDIVVPGGNSGHSILSTWPSDVGTKCPAGLRKVNGGLYCEADGTSMATGIASGVAALIMSLRPDLDADEVQEILLDTAFPIAGTREEVGRGRLDAAKAVRLVLDPRLVYTPETTMVSSLQGHPMFMVTLPLTNPSLEPLRVEIRPTITTSWYALVGQLEGEVSYGKPLDVSLIFTPTAVDVGNFSSSIQVTTTTVGGGTSLYLIDTGLDVHASFMGPARMFMPWAGTGQEAFRWAEPDFIGRINYAISGTTSIVVDLPFTMTVGERSYNDLRIFIDGFVVATASAFPPTLPNHCLDNQTWPSFSVYGWWSDLSVGESSTLSTFQPDADRFVVEYKNFISAGSSDPDDSVSLQIVLSRNGQVELNYAACTRTHADKLNCWHKRRGWTLL